MKPIKGNGFTLIELMVSMVIAGLIISGVYGIYTAQQKSYTTQEQVAEMQQKIRASIDFMARDIRMACYNDPDNNCNGTGILMTDKDKFEFEYCDKDDNGKIYKETFKYELYDANNDGTIDLGRTKGGGTSVIAEGVDAIEFIYLGKDGNKTALPKDIRSIQISMLLRATYPDRKYIDKTLYIPASGDASWRVPNPANDSYHRRLLITTINLRNAGDLQ